MPKCKHEITRIEYTGSGYTEWCDKCKEIVTVKKWKL